MADKIYKIININFADLIIDAYEIDFTAEDVPESEVFMMDDLNEFKIKLHNQKKKTDVIDFGKWVKNHGL